ncbi:hypothetical protein HZH68_002907 [Vespula germanica]|uniref:Uncharacterized protein n=1 Tax=Vespula germanica TaxID=30212 RepID=A0A834U2D6_VESGE|nr:hypothetical protein HZH68_002907 [Vespula germanica]
MVSYQDDSLNYRLLDLYNKVVIITQDMVFNEKYDKPTSIESIEKKLVFSNEATDSEKNLIDEDDITSDIISDNGENNFFAPT